jgi:protein involved in polysaccharide export with SLBB domain
MLALFPFPLASAQPLPQPSDEQEDLMQPEQEVHTTPPPTRALAVPPQLDEEGNPILRPFGANLFMGNFLKAREDGLNAGYVIMPGDHVSVNAWGSVSINRVFVVDGQGNIFLPDIGPIHLEGVKNAQLTDVVKQGIKQVYSRYVDVYTNLITAKPVGVYVTGGVVRPGRYAGIPSDSVLFFMDQAGGVDSQLGSYREISILRNGKVLATVDLYDFILRGKMQTHQFEEGDTILVQRRGPIVELQGNVASPSLIEFRKGQVTGTDALSVIPGAARTTEVTIRGNRYGSPFAQTMSIADFSTFPLEDGDAIELRDDGRSDSILVQLEGEFDGPSLLAVKRGSRLVDVLNHVRVDPTLANTGSVYLRRLSVAKAQKDTIDDSLFRLERSALLGLSSTDNEASIRVKEAELTRKFVERARLVQPLGRVVTTRRDELLNVLLEEGDQIVIPLYSNLVHIGGEVFMSQAVTHIEGGIAGDYIKLAGGYTDRAQKNHVIILRSNADIVIADADTPVRPGDEVLVPPRVDKKHLQNFMDITQVVYQIAVAAGVVVALF